MEEEGGEKEWESGWFSQLKWSVVHKAGELAHPNANFSGSVQYPPPSFSVYGRAVALELVWWWCNRESLSC